MDHEGFFLARRRWRHAVMAVAVCSIAGLGTTTAAAQPATPEDLAEVKRTVPLPEVLDYRLTEH